MSIQNKINKMGKRDKEHRKKVAKRNEAIKIQQKKLQKVQEDFIKQLIEKEKLAGKFDNNPSGPTLPGVNGPLLDLGQGPQI